MKMHRRWFAFGAVSVFVAVGLAHAADQTILGSSLTVKNPSTTDKRKVTGKAKENASPNTIVGNPTLLGGSVTISANGGTPSSQVFPLPQGTNVMTGKPFWSGDATKGFKYKDPKGQNGAVKSVQIKKSASGKFSIKVVATGKNGAVLVVPPNPGTNGCVLLALNGGDTYSVAFLPNNGIIKNKDGTLYQHKKVTLEGSCIFGPTTTTTSTTIGTTTSTTLYGSPSRAFMDHFFGLLD